MPLNELKKLLPVATKKPDIHPPNGGGWVENAATVKAAAFVGLNAKVYGHAQVHGNARVSDRAQVFGDAWKHSPLQIQGSKGFLRECEKS